MSLPHSVEMEFFCEERPLRMNNPQNRLGLASIPEQIWVCGSPCCLHFKYRFPNSSCPPLNYDAQSHSKLTAADCRAAGWRSLQIAKKATGTACCWRDHFAKAAPPCFSQLSEVVKANIRNLCPSLSRSLRRTLRSIHIEGNLKQAVLLTG